MSLAPLSLIRISTWKNFNQMKWFWSNKQNELTEKYLESSDFVNIQNKLTQAFSSEYFSMSYFNKKVKPIFIIRGKNNIIYLF